LKNMSCDRNANKIVRLACRISAGIPQLSGKQAFYAGATLAVGLGVGSTFREINKKIKAEKIRDRWRDTYELRSEEITEWAYWVDAQSTSTDNSFIQLVQKYGRNGILFEIERQKEVIKPELEELERLELEEFEWEEGGDEIRLEELREFDDGLSRYEKRLRAQPPNQQDKVAQELAESRGSAINFPPNQKAAVDLQKNFVGARVDKQDMLDALNDWGEVRLPPDRLLGNTWLAEGVYGRIVYDDLGSGECIIQAVEPRIGQEVKLASGLEAVSKKAGEKERKTGKLTQAQKAKRLIDKKLLSPISSIGSARSKKWVQNIKDPSRQKAAVELQENFTGFRLDKQNLARVLNPPDLRWDGRVYHDQLSGKNIYQVQGSLGQLFYDDLGGLPVYPERLSGNTYQVQGSLGQLFYDDLGNGRIAIRGIRPTLGWETQLRDGLLKREIRGGSKMWLPT
jgi:hypothetical protein